MAKLGVRQALSVLAKIRDTRVAVNVFVTCLVDGPPGGAVVLGVR